MVILELVCVIGEVCGDVEFRNKNGLLVLYLLLVENEGEQKAP